MPVAGPKATQHLREGPTFTSPWESWMPKLGAPDGISALRTGGSLQAVVTLGALPGLAWLSSPPPTKNKPPLSPPAQMLSSQLMPIFSHPRGSTHQGAGRELGLAPIGSCRIGSQILPNGGPEELGDLTPLAGRGGRLRPACERMLGEPGPEPTPDLRFSQKTGSHQIQKSPPQGSPACPSCPGSSLLLYLCCVMV